MSETWVDPRYRVRAVGRALDLLFAIGDAPAPLDLTTLARQVDLHPSTAFRLLETLRSRDMVRVARDGYTVGAGSFELGSSFLRATSIWSGAPELAERLSARVNETASVGILDDDQVLYIAIAHGQREIGIQSVAGTRHPAYATALGKTLLAQRSWREVAQALRRYPPERLTQRTITDARAFRRELERVSEQGFAVDDEERQLGVTCIAAPIHNHRNEVVAAISISGPTHRIKEVGKLALIVKTYADDASRLLGMPAGSEESLPVVPTEVA